MDQAIRAIGPRILLYSHDTVGLGHLRRNQAIACGLAHALENSSILMVSGARQSTMFDMTRCVDFVTIPALDKSADGTYLAKNSGLSTSDAVMLRSDIIRCVVQSFQPDLLVVDKVPRGVYGELEPALKWLRVDGHARCVLGLRDILDDPQTVQCEWARDENELAIQQYYDSVWVYGDRQICDVAREYRFTPSTAAGVHYAGYLDRQLIEPSCCVTPDPETRALQSRKFVLCMVGGGEDGASLATAFARARLPSDTAGVVLTGPFMPSDVREYLHQCANRSSQLHVIEFHRRPEWLLAHAERIVAMGGYNTVCEILSRRKTALIVPRVTPRTEQLIRAERMSELGLLEMLHPDDLDPSSLSAWIRKSINPPHDARRRIRFDGLSKVPRLASELLKGGARSCLTHGDPDHRQCRATVAAGEGAR